MVRGCDRRGERDEKVFGLGHGDRNRGMQIRNLSRVVHRATLEKAGMQQQMIMVVTVVMVVVLLSAYGELGGQSGGGRRSLILYRTASNQPRY